MATRPGRKGEISGKRGLASIATRVHVTSNGIPLTGQADRHAKDRAAIYEYVRYAGKAAGRAFQTDADVLISVGRPVSFVADVTTTITRDVGLSLDVRLVIAQPLSNCFDARLVVTRKLFCNADVLAAIRRGTGATAPKAQAADPVLEFLGKGLKFPFTFQRSSGGAQISTATSSDHAHIHESIRQILGTKKGERFMRPEFGTRLHELIFEPNDRLLYGLIRHEVIEALDEWEPRIIITDVLVDTSDSDDHLVLVNINYRLISSQVEGNMVFPFWRELE